MIASRSVIIKCAFRHNIQSIASIRTLKLTLATDTYSNMDTDRGLDAVDPDNETDTMTETANNADSARHRHTCTHANTDTATVTVTVTVTATVTVTVTDRDTSTNTDQTLIQTLM